MKNDVTVYPLFAAVGVAVGICGMQLVRNISGNPEVSLWVWMSIFEVIM
ncbi:putative NADH-ubiquinone reductase complex 1 MLRQ subunit [Helianthus debilis subsp. tardiflorus]